MSAFGDKADIEPCLPSPAKAPPAGSSWLHEIKHDGFRILARRDSAGVRLITRPGNDFTSRFPLAVEVISSVSVTTIRRAELLPPHPRQ
jgi:bifunctional non-homologous end joining protein LigD